MTDVRRRCTGRVSIGMGMVERCVLPARHKGPCRAGQDNKEAEDEAVSRAEPFPGGLLTHPEGGADGLPRDPGGFGVKDEGAEVVSGFPFPVGSVGDGAEVVVEVVVLAEGCHAASIVKVS